MMIVIMMMIASYTNDDDRHHDNHSIVHGWWWSPSWWSSHRTRMMMIAIMMMIASYTNDDHRHHDDHRIVHKWGRVQTRVPLLRFYSVFCMICTLLNFHFFWWRFISSIVHFTPKNLKISYPGEFSEQRNYSVYVSDFALFWFYNPSKWDVFRNVSHERSNCEMFCSDERPGIYSHFVCDTAWSASPWCWKGNLQPSDCTTDGHTPWFCENGWGWEGGRDEDLGVGAENAWSGKGGTQVILLCWCCWCRWWAWWSGCWWWSSLWCTWWPQMVLIIILCGQNTIKCLIQFLSVQLSWYVWPHCYSSWWCEEVNQMKLNINLSRLHFWILFRSSPSVGDVSFELAPKRFRYIWNLYLHIDIFLAIFGDSFCTIWCHQVQQDIAASPGYEVNIKFESFLPAPHYTEFNQW